MTTTLDRLLDEYASMLADSRRRCETDLLALGADPEKIDAELAKIAADDRRVCAHFRDVVLEQIRRANDPSAIYAEIRQFLERVRCSLREDEEEGAMTNTTDIDQRLALALRRLAAKGDICASDVAREAMRQLEPTVVDFEYLKQRAAELLRQKYGA